MRYEEALDLAGPIGRYQWTIVFLTYLYAIGVAFNNMSMVFLGASPDHWCRVSDIDHLNLSTDQMKQVAIPKEKRDGILQYSQCSYYACEDWTDALNRVLRNDSDYSNCTIASCKEGWIYDQSEYTSTIATEWDLVCDRRPLEAMTRSVYMAGLMVGVLTGGLIADWLGRKPTMICAILLVCAFAVGVGFSNSLLTFTILRFIVGAGSIGASTTSYVLSIEYVGPGSRTKSAVFGAYFWTTGVLLVAALAYAIRDWKYLALSYAVPQLLLILPLLYIPESPRWLYSKKKDERGEIILRDIARRNKKTLPEPLKVELDAPKRRTYPWDFFRYPRMRIRTLVMYFNWCVVSMVYYGLFLNPASVGGNERLNFVIYALLEYPSYFFAHATLDRFGRRFFLSFGMILGGLSLLSTLAVPAELVIAKVVLTMIGKWSMDVAFVAVYIFAAEIFPTTMRNNGLSSSSFCARIGGIIAPQVALLGSYNWIIPPIVFGSLALMAGLSALLLPETARRDLPETILEAENFARKQPRGSVAPAATMFTPHANDIGNTKHESGHTGNSKLDDSATTYM